MIDRGLLTADEWSYSGSGVAWKARLWFFLGIAMLIGSFGGSVVCHWEEIYLSLSSVICRQFTPSSSTSTRGTMRSLA